MTYCLNGITKKGKVTTKKAKDFAAEMKINFDNIKSKTKGRRKVKVNCAIVDESMKQLSEMPLHGQHQRLVEEDFVDKDLSFKWLKDSTLKGTQKV